MAEEAFRGQCGEYAGPTAASSAARPDAPVPPRPARPGARRVRARVPPARLIILGGIDFGFVFKDFISARQGVSDAARQASVGQFGSTARNCRSLIGAGRQHADAGPDVLRCTRPDRDRHTADSGRDLRRRQQASGQLTRGRPTQQGPADHDLRAVPAPLRYRHPPVHQRQRRDEHGHRHDRGLWTSPRRVRPTPTSGTETPFLRELVAVRLYQRPGSGMIPPYAAS